MRTEHWLRLILLDVFSAVVKMDFDTLNIVVGIQYFIVPKYSVPNCFIWWLIRKGKFLHTILLVSYRICSVAFFRMLTAD